MHWPLAMFPALAGWHCESIETGMSGAVVLRLTRLGEPVQYIKAGEGDRLAASIQGEAKRLAWLGAAGAPVPHLLESMKAPNARAALRMDALVGMRALECNLPPDAIATAIAIALRELHGIPAADCPFDASLGRRLAEARANVAAGLVEPQEFDEANLGLDPTALLARLLAMEQPVESLVVTHGDATLANVVIAPDGTAGFIDCARAGLADRDQDLALMARDIRNELGDEAEATFWREYGIAPDSARLAYYELLEEFA